MIITATCSEVPDSRTTARGSAWRAIAIVDGVAYSATSRSSAVGALCRELVASGVPDGAMQVTFDGVRGQMTIRSIHKFAGTTLSEGDASIRRVPWRPYQSPQNTRPLASGEAGMGLAMPAALPDPRTEHASVGASPLSVTCEGCGQAFTPKRSDARTCGAACRKRVSRRLAA
jgi:hypothetical protein